MTIESDARNVVLTGFMGTGKTSVAREVARRLGWPFVDMDLIIQARLGMPIDKIFARRGEAFFREHERALCRELSARRGLVVATGGGTLIPKENRATLGRSGLLICLTCEVEEILRRLAGAGDRPLLATANRRRRIEELLARRAAAYARIPHQIDTTRLTVEEVASEVIELLDRGAGER